MNLKNLTINERSKTQKVTYCVILLYEISKIGKSIDTEIRLVDARGEGEEKIGGKYLNKYGVFLWGGERFLNKGGG